MRNVIKKIAKRVRERIRDYHVIDDLCENRVNDK